MSLAHQHGPHCSHGHRHHDHDSNVHKPGPGEHVHGKDCSEHQGHKKCKHGSDEKYKELTPKEYEKRRNKRKLRQWSRRGNHTLQNIIAAVWIWSLPESEIRYYYDYYMYDKILLFHALQILALILFFISSLAEPGFLSSNAIPNDTNDKLKKNEDEAISLLSSTDDIDAENPGMVAVDPNNKPPPSFCRSCKFLRPLRAKHCYMCDRCVPRFDHHCPLIEQCVGAKNYRQFYVLCWAQMFVSGWSFLISINCLFYSDSTNRSYIGWFWRIGLFLWMLYQAFMALSLVSFHTYLVCTQQTTYEYLKPRKLKERLQFEQQNESSLSVDLLGDIRPKERRRKGIPGPLVLMRKMCIAMGFCLCEYPFSEGLMKNWYGFVTAKCLERPEYFKTIPVKLVRSTPEVSNDATSDHAPNVDLNQVDAAK